MRVNAITLFVILACIATLIAVLFDLAVIAGHALEPWLGWMLP